MAPKTGPGEKNNILGEKTTMKRNNKNMILSIGLSAVIGLMLISPVLGADAGSILVSRTDMGDPTTFEYIQIQITDNWNMSINFESENGELFGFMVYESEQFVDFPTQVGDTPLIESTEPLSTHSLNLFAKSGDRVLYILFINDNEELIQINYEYSFETGQSIPGFSFLFLAFGISSGVVLLINRVKKLNKKGLH